MQVRRQCSNIFKVPEKNANLSTQNCIPSEIAFKDEAEIDLFRQAKSEGIHFQLANATKKMLKAVPHAEGKP